MATTKAAPGKKGLINFDFLQKLGKVLMTVIAVMPAAGLMISLGKLVQMGGGDIAAVMTIGTTMENIGWAVINNLHILFAVAIGGSWAKERAGGAFAAVLAFALINVITGNIFGVTSAMLANNLINLGLYDEARDALAAAGKSLSEIEEVEPEPSLGNGGLGRLAACFLDSLATLNLPGDGVGLRYHFGLFHQSFEDGVQNEKPDPWLTAHSWAEKTDITYPVELAGKEYTARLYKLAVTG